MREERVNEGSASQHPHPSSSSFGEEQLSSRNEDRQGSFEQAACAFGSCCSVGIPGTCSFGHAGQHLDMSRCSLNPAGVFPHRLPWICSNGEHSIRAGVCCQPECRGGAGCFGSGDIVGGSCGFFHRDRLLHVQNTWNNGVFPAAYCKSGLSSPYGSFSTDTAHRRDVHQEVLPMTGISQNGTSSPMVERKITLHKWYLVRCGSGNASEVAVGGFLTSELLERDRRKTEPIIERVEKCKLKTKDGFEVKLIGLIDEHMTYLNGFPCQMVHYFLSGFPYIWVHLLHELSADSTLKCRSEYHTLQRSEAGEELKDSAENIKKSEQAESTKNLLAVDTTPKQPSLGSKPDMSNAGKDDFADEKVEPCKSNPITISTHEQDACSNCNLIVEGEAEDQLSKRTQIPVTIGEDATGSKSLSNGKQCDDILVQGMHIKSSKFEEKGHVEKVDPEKSNIICYDNSAQEHAAQSKGSLIETCDAENLLGNGIPLTMMQGEHKMAAITTRGSKKVMDGRKGNEISGRNMHTMTLRKRLKFIDDRVNEKVEIDESKLISNEDSEQKQDTQIEGSLTKKENSEDKLGIGIPLRNAEGECAMVISTMRGKKRLRTDKMENENLFQLKHTVKQNSKIKGKGKDKAHLITHKSLGQEHDIQSKGCLTEERDEEDQSDIVIPPAITEDACEMAVISARESESLRNDKKGNGFSSQVVPTITLRSRNRERVQGFASQGMVTRNRKASLRLEKAQDHPAHTVMIIGENLANGNVAGSKHSLMEKRDMEVELRKAIPILPAVAESRCEVPLISTRRSERLRNSEKEHFVPAIHTRTLTKAPKIKEKMQECPIQAMPTWLSNTSLRSDHEQDQTAQTMRKPTCDREMEPEIGPKDSENLQNFEGQNVVGDLLNKVGEECRPDHLDAVVEQVEDMYTETMGDIDVPPANLNKCGRELLVHSSNFSNQGLMDSKHAGSYLVQKKHNSANGVAVRSIQPDLKVFRNSRKHVQCSKLLKEQVGDMNLLLEDQEISGLQRGQQFTNQSFVSDVYNKKEVENRLTLSEKDPMQADDSKQGACGSEDDSIKGSCKKGCPGKQKKISRSLALPPPLPAPRVPVSRRLVSEAFGLKVSRHGRLLVPPLAYWRSQTLVHDMDGGIIAILDGSEKAAKCDTGLFNFNPPSEVKAIKLRERFCAAATKVPHSLRKYTALK